MDEIKARRLMVAGLLGLLGLLGACADQQAKREEQLGEFLGWLPGHYDNTAQASREAQQNVRSAHEPIALTIIPVIAPRLGHHVFYAEESAANDPHRVMSERMFSFDIDEKRGIIGLMWEFNDPRRWRDGAQNPELFTGLVIEDVASAGCEFMWKRSGEDFIATHDAKHCHSSKMGAAGQNAAELTPDSLTLAGFEFRRSKR